MPAPTDYTTHVLSPFQAAVQGTQAGLAVRQVRDNEDAAAAKAAAIKQKQADVSAVAQNPNRTQEDINRLRLLYPEDDAAYGNVWNSMDAAKQDETFKNMQQVQFALENDDVGTAKSLLKTEEDAANNSGDAARAAGAQAVHRALDMHPDAPQMVSYQIHRTLLQSPRAKEYIANQAAWDANRRLNELQPSAVRTARAEAGIKEEDAANRQTQNALDNQVKVEGIQTAQQARSIADLKAKLDVSTNDIERQRLQLEIDKAQQAAGEPQDVMDGLTTGLNTVNEVLNHKALKNWLDTGVGFWGSLMSAVHGTDSADLATVADTLSSQQFLSQAKQLRGMGALSDAEGKRLEGAIANLSRSQSKEQFIAHVKAIRDELNRAQAKIIAMRGKGLPGGGRGAPVLHSDAHGLIREGDINDLLKRFPGATREQAIQYLTAPPRTPE